MAVATTRWMPLPRQLGFPQHEHADLEAQDRIPEATNWRQLHVLDVCCRSLCILLISVAVLLATTTACALTPPMLILVYWFGWIMWLSHLLQPCDVPLESWLGVYLCYLTFMYMCRPVLFQVSEERPWKSTLERLNPVVAVLWLLYGRSLLLKSKTCAETSPSMVVFLRWFSVLALLLHGLHCALLCANSLGVRLLLLLARHGWLPFVAERGGRLFSGAPEAVEAMEILEYDPKVFADPTDPLDSRPQDECCICLESYSGEPSKMIRKTPCGHLMHHECLKTWLEASRTCPFCRRNLAERHERNGGHSHGDAQAA